MFLIHDFIFSPVMGVPGPLAVSPLAGAADAAEPAEEFESVFRRFM